ncbi:chromate efflux transporter [Microbacterium sp. cx-59]|uniref:chromate efflux transporter n=1 Tax=Microbacterium sp. cx-59 TaxID=2891207 RepID=UPI001E6455A8|nr:chromate efflux transporter [Microbacterium sp. cx-59]MCC4907024.1 chromate efflux transporter [Microbacterium sp. cx-59]
MRESTREVWAAFGKLGLTSFGGPIAHLGFFRTEFVERRRWLSDNDYSELVALCQFLPGPASSQVGFALGYSRAGLRGALAAFIAFTLPSAVLMVAVASGSSLIGGPVGDGAIAGLKVAAIAIVAQAVWSMTRTLTPDKARAGIAVGAAFLVLLLGSTIGQIPAIILGAAAGVVLCRRTTQEVPATGARLGISRRAGAVCLGAFVGLLIALPLLASWTGSGAIGLLDGFFRAGSLVFGGGHVFLPLLESEVVQTGWVSVDQFLAGYGVAQIVPGPLFTFSAYLGVLADVGPGGIAGALLALTGAFLPGFLVLLGVLPFWSRLRTRSWAPPLLRGANAAVVGILAAALYDPLFVTSITGAAPLALALVGFVLLTRWSAAPWIVVLLSAIAGMLGAVVSG